MENGGRARLWSRAAGAKLLEWSVELVKVRASHRRREIADMIHRVSAASKTHKF